MKHTNCYFISLVVLLFSHCVLATDISDMPMPIIEEETLVHTWLAKSVHESRLLCGMEDLSVWEHHGVGAIEITDRYAKTGKKSLKMTSKTFIPWVEPLLAKRV